MQQRTDGAASGGSAIAVKWLAVITLWIAGLRSTAQGQNILDDFEDAALDWTRWSTEQILEYRHWSERTRVRYGQASRAIRVKAGDTGGGCSEPRAPGDTGSLALAAAVRLGCLVRVQLPDNG